MTRELSILRAAQNASVASNTSVISNASSASVTTDPANSQAVDGTATIPPRQPVHRRTSSNNSARSLTANLGSVSSASLAGISSPAPLRVTAAPYPIGGISLSRQNSTASRRSRTGSPSPSTTGGAYTPQLSGSYSSQHINEPPSTGVNYFGAQRHPPGLSTVATPGSSTAVASTSDVLSPGILPATSRYEETAYYRSELDTAKKENEALKRRIRELERQVRDRRASDASRVTTSSRTSGAGAQRGRSDSVSTATSAGAVSGIAAAAAAAAGTGGGNVGGGGGAGIAAQRAEVHQQAHTGAQQTQARPRVVSSLSTAGSVGVGVPEEEVRVGESAASTGIREQAAAGAAAEKEARGQAS